MDGYELSGRWVPAQATGGDFSPDTSSRGQLQLHTAGTMGNLIPATLTVASMLAMLVGAAQSNGHRNAFTRVAVASQKLLTNTGAFVTTFSARLIPHDRSGRLRRRRARAGVHLLRRRLSSAGANRSPAGDVL